jgi:hypothetical protein
MSDCKHSHLSFEDGALYIHCVDCDQNWAAVTRKWGPLDFSLGTQYLVDKGRHTRWELPRDKKLDKK